MSTDAGTPTTIEFQAAHIEALKSELTALRAANEAAQAEIAVSDKLLAERNRVLAAIPECGAHGDQCVPHALEWITSVQAELERERKARVKSESESAHHFTIRREAEQRATLIAKLRIGLDQQHLGGALVHLTAPEMERIIADLEYGEFAHKALEGGDLPECLRKQAG